MTAHHVKWPSDSDRRGFTLLELIVVVSIISMIGVVALTCYDKLLVDVERTSMEHDLGVMRSAIGLQVAAHYVAGNLAGLEALAGSNPIALLAEPPKNYLTGVSRARLAELLPGSWYYDGESQTLVYLVRNRLYFETELEGVARAEFRIVPVYSEREQGGVMQTCLSGLTLQTLQPYRWLRPWG